MDINSFIRINGIREADAIILRKKFLGMVDHYAIYIGRRRGIPTFVANYSDGVKEIPTNQLEPLLRTLEPKEVEPFPGSEHERSFALRRAISRVGEKAYNYISNNCEHFKNWVHYGDNWSQQVDKAGKIAIGTSLGIGAIALAKKNPKVALVGLGVLLVGLALRKSADGE